MSTTEIERKRASNLWESLGRKFPAIAKSAHLEPLPTRDLDGIGGLALPKDEILTHACAATDPEVYERWGTVLPAALLLIGPEASGKTLLAQALAVRTGTPFLRIEVPDLVHQLVHASGNVHDMLQAFVTTLSEMPRLTILFREIDLTNLRDAIALRPGLAIGPVMDFVIDLLDRTISVPTPLVVGSTSHADELARNFLEPGRFERVVEVNPLRPDDVVEALELHARDAEKRAGRTLFAEIEWGEAVRSTPEASIGAWVGLLRAVLRRKARCEVGHEDPGLVTAADLVEEIERFNRARSRLPRGSGRYL
ncbi:MAG: AAA family ATPase [Myxococcota bacterium]